MKLKWVVALILSFVVFSFFGSAVQTWWTKKVSIVNLTYQYDSRQQQMENSTIGFRYTDEKLADLLKFAPTSSRVRMNIIHSTKDASYIPLLRYDTTNAVVRKGHVTGDLVSDNPLAEWNDYISSLLKGDCIVFGSTNSISNSNVTDRMARAGVKSFLACPMSDNAHHLLGGIFMSWDDYDMPQGAEMSALINEVEKTSKEITDRFYDLRVQ